MIISIKVYPSSRKNEMTIEQDLTGNLLYKIHTTQVAESGKANKFVIELLVEHFKVAKRDVKILQGLTSRNKIIEVKLK
jgi:uncharacterized protein (TIGR00251 family)